MNQWSGFIGLLLIDFLLSQFFDRASPVSTARLKIVLLIMELKWDNLAEAVGSPIRAFVPSLHGKDVFLVFL
jgi:hypothetical protein